MPSNLTKKTTKKGKRLKTALISSPSAKKQRHPKPKITEHKGVEEALRQSEETAKRLSQENAIVAEIGRIISSTLNIDEVYERFAEEVGKLIPIDRIAINIINSRDNTTITAYVAGAELPHRLKGSVYPSVGTITEEVKRTRKSLLIHEENYKEYLDRFPGFALYFEAGFRSLVLIPLLPKDEVVGFLQLYSKKPNAYSKEDLRLAERVGHQIAGTIANAQLFTERNKAEEALRKSEETARRLSQENAIVAEIGRIISSTLNIDEVYERFAEEVGKLIPIDRITINIINPRDNTTFAAYIAGAELSHRVKGSVYPSVGTFTEEVKRTRKSLLIHEENYKEYLDRFPGFALSFEAGFRSLMLIPLISKGEVVGVLQLRSKKPNAYSEKDLRLAERVGNQIAGAIANAQLFAELNKVEGEQRKLILQLQDALARVKTLSGLIPICASCKKIRDDKGYWNQLETYIHDRSEAEFSHGICPECSRKLYPDFFDDEDKEKV
ncbi:MAG: GAF domain-containing protein [Thermodesulfobacteriota bacterium]|nr:GAF domain-containing protein [Thermodesulfobacteriota bacterium]